MVTRDATWDHRPETDTSGLIRGAWKPLNPDPRRLGDRAVRDKQLVESLGLCPRLEHWTGTVAGETPHDLPRITVRLYDDATVEEEIGAVIYWQDSGACSYTLELREEGDGWLRVDQVTESPECAPQGEIWVTIGVDLMLATWHRPDGSEWFTSELRLD
jgi:hypothetical protein